jgi:L-alanine-DL-glutamate epimerase-like enolase superfamily enzyme
MRVKEIEIIWLDVPLREVPARNMARERRGWCISELCRVTADNGLVGYGETLPHYTWGPVSEAAIGRAKGANPFELMWDDSLGAGLQMALFDLAGKAAEVPVHRLLGEQVRDRCPLSWWGIDMSPADYASEAREAVSEGYRSFKQKARPWWDVYAQLEQTAAEVDIDFALDYDFNEYLLNAANALPVLKSLEDSGKIAIFEEPIPRRDLEGNRRLRAQVRAALAFHYFDDDFVANIRDEACDGYVLSGGASAVLRAGHACAQARKPFWLQLVGTAWTTAFTLHLGAVLSHAQWPHVTCMNMYRDQLVLEPLVVSGGFVEVPDGPGLGVEFDEAALKYRVETAAFERPDALYAVAWANGERAWFVDETSDAGFSNAFLAGNLPLFEHGVSLETYPNDGTAEWRELRAHVLSRGIVRQQIGAPTR